MHGVTVRATLARCERLASGVLTPAEIALPPESDCAGPGFLVARRAALWLATPPPAEVAPPAAFAALADGDDVHHPAALHCRVVVARADADAHQSDADARHLGELHCRVVVYHQDALHHQDSGDQLKAVQVECLGLQEAHQNHRGAAAECSETPDAYRGVQADHPEFQDDHQDHSDAPAERSGLQVAHQDAPAEHSEFQDDRQACQDAPAEHSEFQDDRQDCQDAPAYRWGVQADYPGDPVSRAPVACPPGDAAVSKWVAGDARLAE